MPPSKVWRIWYLIGDSTSTIWRLTRNRDFIEIAFPKISFSHCTSPSKVWRIWYLIGDSISTIWCLARNRSFIEIAFPKILFFHCTLITKVRRIWYLIRAASLRSGVWPEMWSLLGSFPKKSWIFIIHSEQYTSLIFGDLIAILTWFYWHSWKSWSLRWDSRRSNLQVKWKQQISKWLWYHAQHHSAQSIAGVKNQSFTDYRLFGTSFINTQKEHVIDIVFYAKLVECPEITVDDVEIKLFTWISQIRFQVPEMFTIGSKDPKNFW